MVAQKGGKESACQCRRCKICRFSPWVGKNPWRREWQPTPVFLPGQSHGQRSLAGYSPWGHKESDTTEWLNNNNSKQNKSDFWGWGSVSGPQGSDQRKSDLGRPRGGHSAPLMATVPALLPAKCTTGEPHGQIQHYLHLDSIFSLAIPTVGSLGICQLLYRWSLSPFPPGFTPISPLWSPHLWVYGEHKPFPTPSLNVYKMKIQVLYSLKKIHV